MKYCFIILLWLFTHQVTFTKKYLYISLRMLLLFVIILLTVFEM